MYTKLKILPFLGVWVVNPNLYPRYNKNAGLTRHFYIVFNVIRSWPPCVAAVPASEYALVAAQSVPGVSQSRHRQ